MTQKILGPEGSRRRKRFWLVPMVMAALAVVFYVSGAGAVLTNSPSQFESGDGNLVNGTANHTDWNCFVGNTGFHSAAGINVGAACAASTGALAVTDPVATTTDNSWVNGQKMDNACAKLAQNKNQGKNDFTYVATYSETRPADKHTYLYGATIRVSPNGSASENVELNQVPGTPACPITRTAGDRLLAFDYKNGGTSLDLHVLTWVDVDNPATPTINESTLGGNNGVDCIISNDHLPCWGANVLQPSASTFEGQANQAAIAAADNGINAEALDAGRFAEFGVDLTSALNASTTTCQTFAQTVWESRSSGSSFSSNPEDIAIENKTISNCGGIIIRKVTNPTPDVLDSTFNFTDNIAGAGDTFGLKNGAAKDFGSSVQAASYSVSETPLAGYTLSNIDCAASTTTNGSSTTIGASGGFDAGDNSIAIVLKAGDTIDCTYTNTLQTATLSTLVDAGPVAPGSQLRDTATVVGSVSSHTPSGDVTFRLCTFAAASTDVCDGSAGHVGTLLTPVGTLTGAGTTATANSPYVNTAAVPLGPGRYCFRATWPGDANYIGAKAEWGGTSGTGECFTVSKINTQTATTPKRGTTSVSDGIITLGQSVTDTAVVTGNSVGGDPTGSVTFHVCKVASPGVCGTGGDPVVSDATSVVGLTGDGDGVAPFTSSAISVAFTPTTTGRYCFRGDYGGSTVYNVSSDSGTNECFTVRDTTGITSAQTWLPNDSATLTSTNGAKLSGSLSFTLYDGPDCGVTKSDGTPGTVVLRSAETFPIAAGTDSPVTKNTTNGLNNTVSVTVTKKVSWKVVFTSDDLDVSGQTKCESSNLTVTN